MVEDVRLDIPPLGDIIVLAMQRRLLNGIPKQAVAKVIYNPVVGNGQVLVCFHVVCI